MRKDIILAFAGEYDQTRDAASRMSDYYPGFKVFRLNHLSVVGVAAALGLVEDVVTEMDQTEKLDRFSPFNVQDGVYREFICKRLRRDLYTPMCIVEHLSDFGRYLNFVTVGAELEYSRHNIPLDRSVLIPRVNSPGEYAVLHRSSMITERPLVVVSLESLVNFVPPGNVNLLVPYEGFSAPRLFRLIEEELQND